MARSILAGSTDYSHQSFSEIVKDITAEKRNVTVFIELIEQKVSSLKESGYWSKNVPQGFKSIVDYSLTCFKTAQEEFESILKEIQIEVQEHHCTRLERVSLAGDKINNKIGDFWHNKYLDQDFENKEFNTVDDIYCDTRDMANNLLDISNIAYRLRDFIGKTSLQMENKSSVNFKNIQFGDNTVVVVGDNNVVNPDQIKKNDLDALEKLLLNHRVSQADINELKEILTSEDADLQNNKLGEKSNTWITKMISKCLDGTWAIGIGAAGKLLADAIKSYYGLFS
jgi:hypothetical protein